MQDQPASASKVVVVGLSKTGTSTLKTMLSTLGYNVCGPRKALIPKARVGDWSAINAVLDSYDAFEDWPWPLTYRHVAERYGERAKCILTTRASFERWFASLVAHGSRSNPFRGMFATYGVYRPDGHDAELRRIYETHNDEVRRFFADKPGRLIEFCLERGDGWEKLCSFLGKPEPGVPVPRINSREAAPNHINTFLNGVITPIYARLG